ncbi:MAG TPA: ABC transporter transmembrane domain-containing protein [Gemmatimonadales bacterium]
MSIAADETHDSADPAMGRRLVGYIRPYFAPVGAAVGLLLLDAALALVGPFLTQRALDVAIPARDAGMLLTLGAVYTGALALSFAGEYAQTVLTTWVGQRVMSDLRRQLFAQLQRLSVPYFDRQPIGRLVTRMTSDVETLNELFSSGVVTVVGDIATLVAISVMMVVVNWRLAVVAFAVLPFMLAVVAFFRRSMRLAFRDIRAAVAKLNAYLQEQLSGVRVIQLFNRRAASARTHGDVNREFLAANLRSITLYALFFPVVEFLTAASIALLLWYAGLRGAGLGLTVGVLAAFIQLVRRFFQPLQDLSEKFNLLQSAMASGERIFRLLDTPVEIPEPGRPVALPQPVMGEIVFDDVWFRYHADAPWALKGVSFRVPPGATAGLVGHTGAGKSTVLSLLLRFYAPTRGRITLDGVDLAAVPTGMLRRAVGFVPQDLFLFRDSLARNLRLDRNVSDEDLGEALMAVGAGRVIDRLPGRLDHVVAERGRSLSVGERQLMSFARALAGNPAVLLLDEATSAVDPETDARIQSALVRLRAGRTSIVVAHRLGTITDADPILVFHHGELRETGSHRTLMARRGLYHRLVLLHKGPCRRAPHPHDSCPFRQSTDRFRRHQRQRPRIGEMTLDGIAASDHATPEASAGDFLPLAALRVRSGPHRGATLPVNGAIASVGADPANNLVVTGVDVAPRHGQLRLRGGVWTFSNFGGPAAAAVDGEPVHGEAVLAPGSLLRLGQVLVAFAPQDSWGDSRPARYADDPMPLVTMPVERAAFWPRIWFALAACALVTAIILLLRNI